jgi:hypothetical protein
LYQISPVLSSAFLRRPGLPGFNKLADPQGQLKVELEVQHRFEDDGTFY